MPVRIDPLLAPAVRTSWVAPGELRLYSSLVGQLIEAGGGGGGLARCACGALAAGPCARCRVPLCGDCCVITEHGAQPWAICRACERRGGRSLRGAWLGLLLWLGGALLVLVALVSALAWWVSRH